MDGDSAIGPLETFVTEIVGILARRGSLSVITLETLRDSYAERAASLGGVPEAEVARRVASLAARSLSSGCWSPPPGH